MSASLTADARIEDERPADAHVSWTIRALAFVIPVLGMIDVPVVGHLLGSDIAMTISAPFLFASAIHRRMPKVIWMALFFVGVWFVAQVFSDAINHTPPEDYLRGWARTLLTGLYVVFFWRLYEIDWRAIVWAAFGLATLEILASFHALNFDLMVRFGGALGVSMAAIAFVTREAVVRGWNVRVRLTAIMLALAVALASLALGTRSAPIPLMACVFFGIVLELFFGRGAPSIRGRLLVVLALCGGLYGTFYAYNLVSASGALGETNKYRTLSQANYQDLSPLRVLLGARPESFVAIQAIQDRPLTGHGSWAKDPYYVGMIRQYSQYFTYGQDVNALEATGFLIPTHSYITGAMVDGGVFAGLYWIFTTVVILRRLLFGRWDVRFYPAIIYCGLSLIYSILFSPYGQIARISAAIYFSTFIALTAPPSGSKPTLAKANPRPLASPAEG